MQSDNAPKKTRKRAEKTTVETPEITASTQPATKSRVTRSSKTTKTDFGEAGSLKHHHKTTPPANLETAAKIEKNSPAEKPTLSNVPARSVTHSEIAELAYSYWLARGCTHGSSEQDWLRAEQELLTVR